MPGCKRWNKSVFTKASGWLVLLLWLNPGQGAGLAGQRMNNGLDDHLIALPAPDTRGTRPLESTLSKRRSIRKYKDSALTLPEVSQLLWAAQGITSKRGFRTAPSAGALYPLELYVAAGQVQGLGAGIFHYLPQKHALELIEKGDQREALARAALGQQPVRQAPAVFIFAAVPGRTAVKYGRRSVRYVLQEVGHAAQNICLQAVALELGSVVIGAFSDEDVARILKLKDDEMPLCLVPVGR